jgi:hypothetical protein
LLFPTSNQGANMVEKTNYAYIKASIHEKDTAWVVLHDACTLTVSDEDESRECKGLLSPGLSPIIQLPDGRYIHFDWKALARTAIELAD